MVMDVYIKKLWYIYTMKYYSCIRKEGNPAICTTWMDPEGIVLSEKSQTEKDKQCMIAPICGI